MPAPEAGDQSRLAIDPVALSAGAVRSKAPTPQPAAVVKDATDDVAFDVVAQNGSPFAVTLQKYFVLGARFDGVNDVSVRSEAMTRTGGLLVSRRTS